MTDSIVRNSSPTVPIANLLFVDREYESGLRVEHVLHPKLHAAGYNVTYRPTRDRAGRLTLLFPSAADAHAAIALLRTEYTFTLTADVTEASMTFALAPGELRPRPSAAEQWTVEVPYQELV